MITVSEDTAMALCLVAYCPVCTCPVQLLPGGKHWRCVEMPTHRDEAHCPECGMMFDTGSVVLRMEPVKAEP